MTLAEALDRSRPLERPPHLAGTQAASAVRDGWLYGALRGASGEIRVQRTPLKGALGTEECRLDPETLPPDLEWFPELYSALLKTRRNAN